MFKIPHSIIIFNKYLSMLIIYEIKVSLGLLMILGPVLHKKRASGRDKIILRQLKWALFILDILHRFLLYYFYTFFLHDIVSMIDILTLRESHISLAFYKSSLHFLHFLAIISQS